MKKDVLLKEFRNYVLELDRQDTLKSTGGCGKLDDSVIRYKTLKNGYSRKIDIPCRSRNKVDARRKGIGKFEFKTGCGEVAKGKDLTLDDAIPQNILPNVDYVTYMPFTTRFNIARQKATQSFKTDTSLENIEKHLDILADIAINDSYVFTRDEFIEMLQYIGKKGLRSSLKVSKHGTRLNIQNLNPVPVGKMYEYIEEHEIPTAEIFLADIAD